MIDINKIIKESAHVKKEMINICTEHIQVAAKIMIQALDKKNKILWCGNGGSAADAQHMSAELMGGLRSHDRSPVASIALTTDTSFITAWANDTDYDSIFSRQIEGIGNSGDVLIAISTSGNSINVINGFTTAKNCGAFTIGLLGSDGGKLNKISDLSIVVPSKSTPRIQESQRIILHIICEIVEEYFSSK